MSNDIRTAIGAALDHPFAEEAFALVDTIEAAVVDLDFEGDPDHHETAAEITDGIVEGLSTHKAATLWAILAADGCGADFYCTGDTTARRIVVDVFAVVEEAVHAALDAAAARPKCSECDSRDIEERGMCSSCHHDAIRSGWSPVFS